MSGFIKRPDVLGDYGQTFYPDSVEEFGIEPTLDIPAIDHRASEEEVGTEMIHPRMQERYGNDEVTEIGS